MIPLTVRRDDFRTAKLPHRYAGIEAASRAALVTAPPSRLLRDRRTILRRRRRSGEDRQQTTTAATNTRPQQLLHRLQFAIHLSSSKVGNFFTHPEDLVSVCCPWSRTLQTTKNYIPGVRTKARFDALDASRALQTGSADSLLPPHMIGSPAHSANNRKRNQSKSKFAKCKCNHTCLYSDVRRIISAFHGMEALFPCSIPQL